MAKYKSFIYKIIILLTYLRNQTMSSVKYQDKHLFFAFNFLYTFI